MYVHQYRHMYANDIQFIIHAMHMYIIMHTYVYIHIHTYALLYENKPYIFHKVHIISDQKLFKVHMPGIKHCSYNIIVFLKCYFLLLLIQK